MKKENRSLLIAALIGILAAFSLSLKSQSTINSFTYTAKFLNSDFQQLYQATRLAAPIMTLTNSMTTYTYSRNFNSSDNQQVYEAIRGLGSAISSYTGSAWQTNGNAIGTNTNFIGTTTNRSLLFKSNNILSFKIDSLGSVYSHGVNAPSKDNIYYGRTVGTNTTNGIENAVFGLNSANTQTAGNGNSVFGTYTARAFKSAGQNCVFGSDAIASATITSGNNVMGVQALQSYTGIGYNVSIGLQNMRALIQGSNNIGIGYRAAETLTAGSNNVFIGNSITSPSTTLNNNILISDGAGNIKYRHDGTNYTLTANTQTLTSGSSGTIATLSDALFTTSHFHGLATIATTTIFWDKYPSSSGASSVSGAVGVTVLPFNCKLVGFSLSISVLGTLGTANTASVYARINNTTDVLLTSSALYSSAASYYSASNLSQLITAGDRIEIKVVPNVTPTNATNVTEAVTLFYSRN